MQFSQVIGQDSLKKQLIQFVDSDRMPHALMFLGSEGRGALPLALATSAYLFCESPTASDSCGVCRHCKKTSKIIHPDLHFAFPVVKHPDKKSRAECFSDDFAGLWRNVIVENPYLSYSEWINHLDAENKQGDINTKECSELIKKLSLKSFTGGDKILIMWLPEFLGNNGNRLLKIIEEPPDDSYLIFVAEDRDRILNTILSRVQILQLAPVEDHHISEYLKRKWRLSDDKAKQISMQAEGNVNLANNLACEGQDNIHEIVLNWFRICFRSDPESLYKWCMDYSAFSKEKQKQFHLFTLRILREFIKLEYLDIDHIRLTGVEYQVLEGLSKVLDLEKSEMINTLVSNSLYSLERNMNPKILMMADCLDVAGILKNEQVYDQNKMLI